MDERTYGALRGVGRTTEPRGIAAERGLKLLDKHQRTLHPRGQVQALRRKAAIAIGKADRCEEYAHLHDDPAAQRAKAREYRQKASDCVAAMLHLNTEHDLGYPVPMA